MELSYGKFLQLVIKKTIVFAIDCKTARIFAHVKNSKRLSKRLEDDPKIGFAGKKRRWNKNNSNKTTVLEFFLATSVPK